MKSLLILPGLAAAGILLIEGAYMLVIAVRMAKVEGR